MPRDYVYPLFNIATTHLDLKLKQVRLLYKDLNTASFKQRVYDRLQPLPVFPHNGSTKQQQEVKVDYAIRRFEIDIGTFKVLICDCCGVLGIAEGVFSRKYGSGKFPSTRTPKKFVYRFPDKTYKYLKPSELEVGVQSEKMKTVCRCCQNDSDA
jgi:hypothetical protein